LQRRAGGEPDLLHTLLHLSDGGGDLGHALEVNDYRGADVDPGESED